MEGDISKALTYQVKKEIAERYFGTRRMIQQDIAALKEIIARINEMYEKKLGMAFVRIYSLLMDKDTIDQFIQLIGWNEPPFYDNYVNESVTIRKRLVHRLHSHGWMKKSRFVNMVMDSYRILYREYQAIADLEAEAREEMDIIREELKIFKGKYSLDEIMSFVRNLDFEGQGLAKVMGSKVDVIDADEIAAKMDIGNIDDVEQELPTIFPVPEPDKVEDELKELAESTYSRHPEIAASAVSMIEEGGNT